MKYRLRKRDEDSGVRSVRIVKVPTHARPVVQARVTAVSKTTFTRTDLPDGDFLMNYYYVRDGRGRLIPEDIDRATHFERVVYDRDGNIIGSTVGELSPRVRW